MLFNLFKKKESKQQHNLQFHQVNVKKKKGKDLYVGQFLSISPDINSQGDEVFYFSAYNEGDVTNKISNQHREYCENYKYAIVRNIINDEIEVLIICNEGYLQQYKVELNKIYNSGDAFIINNGNLIENGNIVGKIVDERYNSQQVIRINSYDAECNKLVVFVEK